MDTLLSEHKSSMFHEQAAAPRQIDAAPASFAPRFSDKSKLFQAAARMLETPPSSTSSQSLSDNESSQCVYYISILLCHLRSVKFSFIQNMSTRSTSIYLAGRTKKAQIRDYVLYTMNFFHQREPKQLIHQCPIPPATQLLNSGSPASGNMPPAGS